MFIDSFHSKIRNNCIRLSVNKFLHTDRFFQMNSNSDLNKTQPEMLLSECERNFVSIDNMVNSKYFYESFSQLVEYYKLCTYCCGEGEPNWTLLFQIESIIEESRMNVVMRKWISTNVWNVTKCNFRSWCWKKNVYTESNLVW